MQKKYVKEGNIMKTKNKDSKKYVLTPKGIAVLALLESGLISSSNDPRIDGFWRIFYDSMVKLDYVQNPED